MAVYETLRKDLGSVGLLLQCCGVPAQWAGEEKLFAETVEALKSTWESLEASSRDRRLRLMLQDAA